MLREKVLNVDFVFGDYVIEVVIIVIIIFIGMFMFLNIVKYGWEGGVVIVGDMV